MATTFESLLGQAQAMYGQIMQGYQTALGAQQTGAQQITNRYNRLQSDVMGLLNKAGQNESLRINQQYAQQAAAMEQRLISSGLSGSTTLPAATRGYLSDAQVAQRALTEKIAGLKAGYTANIGTAGLGAAERLLGQRTGLMGQRLGYQGSYQGNLLNTASRLPTQQQYDDSQYGPAFALLGLGRGGGGGGYYGGGGGGGAVRPLDNFAGFGRGGGGGGFYGGTGINQYFPTQLRAGQFGESGGGYYDNTPAAAPASPYYANDYEWWNSGEMDPYV